jgi:hypothetical protein
MGPICLKTIIKSGLSRKTRDEGYPCRRSKFDEYYKKFGFLEVK